MGSVEFVCYDAVTITVLGLSYWLRRFSASAVFRVWAMAAVSAQAGCQMLSTSFRKDSSAGDLLESSSQAFPGSPRSVARLRRSGASSPRSVPATSASLFSMTPGNFMATVIPRGVMGNAQEDDVKKDLDEDENVLESSNELLDSINNVLADVVDGQKFLKETGRTKPRPMKRRSLMVCLAMGAIQPYLNEVEDRVGCLRRTASTSFAKTLRLASQLSVGASKAIESIAEEYRRSEAQSQPAVEALRRTTSTSLARAKTLVSQLSIGASRAVNYFTEELQRKAEGEQLVPAAA